MICVNFWRFLVATRASWQDLQRALSSNPNDPDSLVRLWVESKKPLRLDRAVDQDQRCKKRDYEYMMGILFTNHIRRFFIGLSDTLGVYQLPGEYVLLYDSPWQEGGFGAKIIESYMRLLANQYHFGEIFFLKIAQPLYSGRKSITILKHQQLNSWLCSVLHSFHLSICCSNPRIAVASLSQTEQDEFQQYYSKLEQAGCLSGSDLNLGLSEIYTANDS